MDELPQMASRGLGANGVVQMGDDNRMIAVFYKKAVANPHRSKAEGRPAFDALDYVQIFEPGDKYTKVDRPVKESDKMRFPNKWALYQQNKDQTASGTPLEFLYPDQPDLVAELKAMKIHNVEQLRDLSDTNATKLQFGGSLREAARKYLEAADKGKTYHALDAKLKDQDSTIKEQNEVIQALKARLDALDEQTERRGPGRPRKEAA